ncbi:MAG: acetylxylan esterase [Mucilaginibacter sp.]|uniref:alpha/beta hydrolase family protein n=1 Tax=Mucilaginibacter sp. TaxID=1882438 RepID=UPI00326434AA
MKSILFVFCFFTVMCQAQIKGTLWDIKGIYDVPQYKTVSTDSAIGIIYQGLTYKGKPQNVFAYYATPGTLGGDRSKDKNLPAVILVHGGGGTAFKEWAIMWAKKGYAAMAMDLRGNGPGKKHIEGGFDEDNAQTPYFAITPGINEQWMFQAVADVILANNLIRSFAEVDINQTAITGISWGGIITCLMAGVDQRYKVGVPVYGCGYLFQNSSMRQGLLQLNEHDRQTWIRQYDPSNYIVKSKMPLLFLNGANDPHFYLDSYAKTYKLVNDKNISIKIGLKHSHHYAWLNDEIFAFVDSYLNHGTPLAKIADPEIGSSSITASVKHTSPINKAFFNYTTDTTHVLMNRKWVSTEVKFNDHAIIAPLPPKGVTLWYLSLIDDRGLQVSGPVQFIDPKL